MEDQELEELSVACKRVYYEVACVVALVYKDTVKKKTRVRVSLRLLCLASFRRRILDGT